MTEFEMMNDEQKDATVNEALAGDVNAVTILVNHAKCVEVYRYGDISLANAMGFKELPAFPSVRW